MLETLGVVSDVHVVRSEYEEALSYKKEWDEEGDRISTPDLVVTDNSETH